MKKSNIDSPYLGSRNLFEEFYELIEEHRFNAENNFELGDFYDYLSDFDRAYQDYNFRNNNVSSNIVTQCLSDALQSFLVIFRFNGFSDRPIFYAFKRFIQFFSLLLEKANKISSNFFFKKNISENFPTLHKGEYAKLYELNDLDFVSYREENFEKYFAIISTTEDKIASEFGIIDVLDHNNDDVEFTTKSDRSGFQLYVSEFKVIKIEWNSVENEFEEVNFHYEMTLDISIKVHNDDAQTLTSILFKLLSGLSNIANVKLTFDSLTVGSLKTKVTANLKDIVAKEEVKEVLETFKETGVKLATAGQVSHVDTKMKNAETDKIKIERKKLEKDFESAPTIMQSQLSNALDLERKALENESLKLKNDMVKIQMIEKLSSLMASGMIEADMLRIDINEYQYLVKSKDEIEVTNKKIDEIT